MEKLIPELKRRGYRIGTVKHHSHGSFEIDQRGKDSWRHAQAGSQHVIIAAPEKIASYQFLEQELTLNEIVAQISDVDLILVEGYKQSGKPSIEIIRGELSMDLISTPEQLVAVVTNVILEISVPQFHFDDVQGIATLIETQFLKSKDDIL